MNKPNNRQMNKPNNRQMNRPNNRQMNRPNNRQMNKPNNRPQLYKAASLVGTVSVWYNLIGLFITLFILVILFIVFAFVHSGWKTVKATLIKEPDCRDVVNNKGNKNQKCDYVFNFTDENNIEHKNKEISNTTITIIKDDTEFGSIEIEYNPTNPDEFGQVFPKAAILSVIGVIIVILLIITIVVYKYRKNKIVKGLATIQVADNIF
jgi:hypothetical protein